MLRKLLLFAFLALVLLLAAIILAALIIDPNDYREQLAARASDALGREVRLNGPMHLSYLPWLALDIEQVRIGNPDDMSAAPALAEIERARASVRVLPLLRGRVEVGAVTVSGARLSLVTAADGSSNLEGLFAAAEVQPADQGSPDLSELSTQAIRFDKLELNLIDLATGSRQQLQLDELELAAFAADQPVALRLNGRLTVDGELLTELQLRGALVLAADLGRLQLQDFRVDYRLPEPPIKGRVRGNLLANLDAQPLRVQLDGLQADGTLDGLVMELSAVQPLQVVVATPLQLELPSARLRLNDQLLELDGSARLGETLAARLAVRGQRLDLSALTGSDRPAPAQSAADADQLPVSALDGLDLDFSLDLDELVLADGLILGQVIAGSRLRNGLLQLEPLQARLFGGGFEGRASVDFNQQPPEVRLSPQLSGVPVAQLAGLLVDDPPVDGAADLELDLSFRGFSPRQMLRSLEGSGAFALAEGVLNGVDLNALVDQELTGSRLSSVARSFGGQTRLQSLHGGLSIHDGVLELPALGFSAAGYAATGNGAIDLAAGQVDYVLVLNLDEALVARMPEALRRATGGQVPLEITGALLRPTVHVDVAGLARGLVRDELDQRLRGLLDTRSAATGRDEPVSGTEEAVVEEDAEEADAEQAGSDAERRREAGRGLLRDLLGSRRAEPPPEPAEAEVAEGEPAEGESEEEEGEPAPAG